MDQMCLDQLNQRLAALERSNRRLRLGLGLVALVAASLLLLGQDGPRQFGEVRVTKLSLVDASGETRIEMKAEAGRAAEINVLGRNEAKASLYADETPAVATVCGPSFAIMLADKGIGSTVVASYGGKRKAVLGTTPAIAMMYTEDKVSPRPARVEFTAGINGCTGEGVRARHPLAWSVEAQ